MEQSDHSSLKLCASAGVDGGGAEGLPDDGLADVRGDEQGNAAAKAVTLLEQLVQQQHNETGHKQLKQIGFINCFMFQINVFSMLMNIYPTLTGEKYCYLDDDQQTDTSADVTWVSVHASQHIHNCLKKIGIKFDKKQQFVKLP